MPIWLGGAILISSGLKEIRFNSTPSIPTEWMRIQFDEFQVFDFIAVTDNLPPTQTLHVYVYEFNKLTIK